GQVCRREEDHDRLPDDELMPVPTAPERDPKGAVPPPPSVTTAASKDAAASKDVAATLAAAPILLVNNIEVVYDHVILVLKGVSLQVAEGDIVALLGANGAGKSTTLKAISNLLS